jgi:broad specificity phosphatase PhoE
MRERRVGFLKRNNSPKRTAQQVTARLDSLIEEIHAFQAPNMHGEKACDVVLVAHGHLLRAFVKRWLKYPMEFPLSMMLEPGGIGVLRYAAILTILTS